MMCVLVPTYTQNDSAYNPYPMELYRQKCYILITGLAERLDLSYSQNTQKEMILCDVTEVPLLQ